MANLNKQNENLLPFNIIAAASKGDTDAICVILKHYDGYITKLSTRTLHDENGNVHSYIDEEIRNRLKIRLIARTLIFNVV